MAHSGIALAGIGLSVGFAAGYITAKGPEQLWARLVSILGGAEAVEEQQAPPATNGNAEAAKGLSKLNADHLGRMRGSDGERSGPPSISGALHASSSGGGMGGFESGGGSGELSPTASIAGSVAGGFSLPPLPGGPSSFGRSSSGGARGDRLKMVVLVRDDLLGRWGGSKASVMIASAVLGLYKRCYRNREMRGALLNWDAQKGAKVVLRCPDEAALSRVMDAARAAGVAAHVLLEAVPAAGPDELPSRTRAVVALGPASHAALVAAGCQPLPPL
ncbi:MAG: hypothetical protein J3K34DRAFT_420633 [Monoraphidium minutum]|nr:MAG: hypothetical protein J3K34DRAFT_420633 [Monoraphidium minutum]